MHYKNTCLALVFVGTIVPYHCDIQFSVAEGGRCSRPA